MRQEFWKVQMNREACRIAFPEWEFDPTDTVIFSGGWDDGYRYSSYTYEDAHLELDIQVIRADQSDRKYVSLRNEDAGKFWMELLN